MAAEGTIICEQEGACIVAPETSLTIGLGVTKAIGCYSEGSNCNFTLDGSNSTSIVSADTPADMTFTWDFGDGSPTQGGLGLSSVTKQYTTPGSYIVTLTVEDSQGGTDVTTFVITQTIDDPVAAISYSNVVGCEFAFIGDGSASRGCGTGLSYSWDFGDGNNSILPNPTHTYAAAGTYIVNLTVTDASGLTNTQSLTVTCTDSQTVADFTFTTVDGVNFTFDASGSVNGVIGEGVGDLTFAWVFGDGNTGNTMLPLNLFGENGTYDVMLTVTDSAGGVSTVTKRIIILRLPVAIQDESELDQLNIIQFSMINSYAYDGIANPPDEAEWMMLNDDDSLYGSIPFQAISNNVPATVFVPTSLVQQPQIDVLAWYDAMANTEVANPSFTAIPTGLTVNLDASASAVGAGCSGSIVSYEWFIFDEDGITPLSTDLTGAVQSFVFTANGDYVIILKITTDTCGEAITGLIVTV